MSQNVSKNQTRGQQDWTFCGFQCKMFAFPVQEHPGFVATSGILSATKRAGAVRAAIDISFVGKLELTTYSAGFPARQNIEKRVFISLTNEGHHTKTFLAVRLF